jgi:hypothetical protein
MTYLTTKIDIFIYLFIYFKMKLICNVVIFWCAMCHNLKPSLAIIMDNGDQYFEKIIIFLSKNLHNAMCQILVDG